MCQFEIIVVVVRGIDTFVHLVVGDGMKHLRIDPAGVFAVDDFAHQPEFRLDFICQPAQFLHKFKGKIACAVEADTVDVNSCTQKRTVSSTIVPHFRVFVV